MTSFIVSIRLIRLFRKWEVMYPHLVSAQASCAFPMTPFSPLMVPRMALPHASSLQCHVAVNFGWNLLCTYKSRVTLCFQMV